MKDSIVSGMQEKIEDCSGEIEWEKERYNAAFTGKLQQGLRDIEEGRGIVKTMAELKAMEDE
jgi:hypothetical protein